VATPTPTAEAFSVSGKIRYYSNDEAVGSAIVEGQGAMSQVVQSDPAGAYLLSSLPAGNWGVVPRKVGDARQGVRVLDSTWALQARLGIRTLSPNQALACDVTGNGSVSVLDATRILQFVIGLIPELPVTRICNSDWAFVPAPRFVPNQTVTHMQVTTGACQMARIGLEPLQGDASGQDFLGIAFGDCTGNWSPTAAGGGTDVTTRSAPGVRLSRRIVGTGQLLVPLSVESTEPLLALEIDLRYDPDQLRLLRVRRSSTTRRALLQFNSAQSGLIRIGLATAEPIDTGQRPVLLVDFERRRNVSAGRARVRVARVVADTTAP